MARTRQWTEEFIVPEFYKLFHGMTGEEQTGVIRGLATIRDCKAAVAVPPQDEATPTDRHPSQINILDALKRSCEVPAPGESAEDAGTQEAP